MASSPPLIIVRIYVQCNVLSIYLEQNDFWKQATFKNFGGTLKYFSNFRATFGCIDKQLFLNSLAQFIYA